MLKIRKIGGEFKMDKECLVLYKPTVKIPFRSTLQDLIGSLEKYNFKLTVNDNRHPNYHGIAWVNEIDKVAIYFHFTDKSKYLDSIMITSVNYYSYESLSDSYNRKQKWLESNYGNAQIINKNLEYATCDYEWKLPNCKIEHFIRERFGDAEGIYFKCF